jgi:hypothetical protein
MLSCRYHGNVQSAPFRRVQNPPGNNFVLVIGCELGQRELGPMAPEGDQDSGAPLKHLSLEQSLFSVLLGRGTGGQFAEEAEQCGSGFLIGEVFERHRGGEVRRGGVEADTDKILVAPGGQRIHHRAEFDGPIFLSGQYDRAGTADGPGASAGRVFRTCVFQTSVFRP